MYGCPQKFVENSKRLQENCNLLWRLNIFLTYHTADYVALVVINVSSPTEAAGQLVLELFNRIAETVQFGGDVLVLSVQSYDLLL